MLTGHSDVFTAKKTLAEGVAGYVLKSQSSRELLDAIRTVAIGIPYVAPEIVEKLANVDSSAED